MTPQTCRRGWTWTEALIVVVVLGGLALLVHWASNAPRGPHHRAHNKNNLGQIVKGMLVYQRDSGGRLPSTLPIGARPVDPWKETINAFEVLAAYSEGNITGSLFVNAMSGIEAIRLAPTATGTAWSAIPGVRMSYAFDWSAPPRRLTAYRVVVGDRNPAYWNGQGICVAFGDGHMDWLESPPTRAPATTQAEDGGTLIASAINSEASMGGVGDDVLKDEPEDRTAPDVDMSRIGQGSASRACLR